MKGFIFFVLLFLPRKSCQVDVTTAAHVTKAVADTFESSCIVLFRPNGASLKEDQELFGILKIMFENKRTKSVAIKDMKKDHVSYRYNRQRCSQMIHVIYGDYTSYWFELADLVAEPGPIWLVFLHNTTITEEHFQYIYIPFDSNFITVRLNGYRVLLSQIYRVSLNHPLRSQQMAEWTPNESLTFLKGFIPYWQRDNMEGIAFRVSAVDSWPLATVTENSTVGGYFGEVWRDLQERLNFTTIYVPANDYATGVWDGSQWNGLIGMIMTNKIDFAISEITMSPERLLAVDFLKPLYTTRYQLFFKSPGLVIQWDLMLRPFRPEVWLALLIWLSTLTLILFLAHHVGQRYELEDSKYNWEYESYHCLFFIVTAFSLQGTTIIPKSIACRLTLATAYLFSNIFVILYSCTLTSMIAVQKPSRPFDSLESFLKDGTYTLEQLPGSDGYAYFSARRAFAVIQAESPLYYLSPKIFMLLLIQVKVVNENHFEYSPDFSTSFKILTQEESTDPVLHEIYQRQFSNLPEEELPKSHRSAIDRICKKGKIAHLGELGVTQIVAREFIDNTECEIIHLEKPLKLLYLTMAVTKDSPYRAAFNYHLRKMMMTGILRRFQNQNFPLTGKAKSLSFNAVRAEQVAQMNVLILFGVFMALLVLCCELLLKPFKSQF